MPEEAKQTSWRLWVGIIVGAVSLAVAAGVFLAWGVASGTIPLNEGGAANSKEKGPNAAFVSFGSTVVNLSEGRLSRYLKVTITLRVPEKSKSEVKKIMEGGKEAVFKNWLICYLSDMKMEDVKGSSSINRLREDIKKGFNDILERYSSAEVDSVFFEEFNIQ